MTTEKAPPSGSREEYKTLRDAYVKLRSDFDEQIRLNRHTPLGFIVAAIVGIVGWVLVLSLLSWWLWGPVELPSIKEPMQVLNVSPITEGDVVQLEISVSKPTSLAVEDTNRFIECENGQLITFTSSPQDLPPGEYVLQAESPPIPERLTESTTCSFVYNVEYRINPLRTESLQVRSEEFVLTPDE